MPGHDGHGFGHGTLQNQPFQPGTLWDHGSPFAQAREPFGSLPTTPTDALRWPSNQCAGESRWAGSIPVRLRKWGSEQHKRCQLLPRSGAEAGAIQGSWARNGHEPSTWPQVFPSLAIERTYCVGDKPVETADVIIPADRTASTTASTSLTPRARRNTPRTASTGHHSLHASPYSTPTNLRSVGEEAI
jgi:hypothetical protein